MNKEIKSIGLAIAALPFGLAIMGLLDRFGIVETNSPSAWSTFKLIISITCGVAYFIGLMLFDERHEDVSDLSQSSFKGDEDAEKRKADQ